MPSNFSMTVRYVPFMEVGRARNLLVYEAKKIGAEYLVFFDEDEILPANALPKLLFHMQNHRDWTFVSGLKALKTVPPEPMVYTDWGNGAHWGFKLGELIKVKFTGMGCSMIRVADLEKLTPRRYHDRDIWRATDAIVEEYFLTGRLATPNVSGIDISSHTEDAYFFALLDQANLSAYVDTGLVCSHYDKRTRTFYLPPNDAGIAIKPDAWNHSPRVVNLGAGHDTSPYEVNVDLRDDPNIQYKCDIRSLPNDWENQFDIAKAHHVLEHFDFRDVPVVLREWVRILKPGGKLRLAVPDMEAVARAIMEGRMDTEIQGNIYGDQGHPYWGQEYYEHNHHRSAFTPRSLGEAMAEAGLVNIIATSEGASAIAEGTKP